MMQLKPFKLVNHIPTSWNPRGTVLSTSYPSDLPYIHLISSLQRKCKPANKSEARILQ